MKELDGLYELLSPSYRIRSIALLRETTSEPSLAEQLDLCERAAEQLGASLDLISVVPQGPIDVSSAEANEQLTQLRTALVDYLIVPDQRLVQAGSSKIWHAIQPPEPQTREVVDAAGFLRRLDRGRLTREEQFWVRRPVSRQTWASLHVQPEQTSWPSQSNEPPRGKN